LKWQNARLRVRGRFAFYLHHGDILLMTGKFQEHFVHKTWRRNPQFQDPHALGEYCRSKNYSFLRIDNDDQRARYDLGRRFVITGRHIQYHDDPKCQLKVLPPDQHGPPANPLIGVCLDVAAVRQPMPKADAIHPKAAPMPWPMTVPMLPRPPPPPPPPIKSLTPQKKGDSTRSVSLELVDIPAREEEEVDWGENMSDVDLPGSPALLYDSTPSSTDIPMITANDEDIEECKEIPISRRSRQILQQPRITSNQHSNQHSNDKTRTNTATSNKSARACIAFEHPPQARQYWWWSTKGGPCTAASTIVIADTTTSATAFDAHDEQFNSASPVHGTPGGRSWQTGVD